MRSTALLSLSLLAACSNSPATPDVHRSDSAGVEIVTSPGIDRPLAWAVVPLDTLFDPASDTVVRRFTVPADIIGGFAGSPDLGLLFASNQNGQVFAIDPQNGNVVRTLNTTAGPIIGGLAYYNGELIGAPFSDSPASRIDPQTGAVLGTLTLGGTGPVVALGGDGPLVPGPYLVTVADGGLGDVSA